MTRPQSGGDETLEEDAEVSEPDFLLSKNLTGKIYLVTGGNAGIGYYTVARLAQHGAHVYMGARSPEKASAAITSIKTLYPNANITLLEMNQTSLHGLINSAGIMATPFEMTKDGHEAQWQMNYLAHWDFTYHLLPLLLSTHKTPPPGSLRIVNLTSPGHFMARKGGISFNDTSLPNNSSSRYGQSKLANTLHAKPSTPFILQAATSKASWLTPYVPNPQLPLWAFFSKLQVWGGRNLDVGCASWSCRKPAGWARQRR